MCPNESDLSAFYDGELDASQSAVVAEHVRTCEACRKALDRLARLSAMAEISVASAIPLDVQRRLNRHVAELPRDVWASRMRIGSAILSGLAAMVLIAIGPKAMNAWKQVSTPHPMVSIESWDPLSSAESATESPAARMPGASAARWIASDLGSAPETGGTPQ